MKVVYCEHLPDKVKDCTGEVLKDIQVLKFIGWKTFNSSERKSLWSVKCHCGVIFESTIAAIKSGNTKSCGCFKLKVLVCRSTKHGQSHSGTYGSFNAMISRCYKKSHKDYIKYGGNGIIVCERWVAPAPQGFLNFLEDMGERPEGTTLNRVNGAKIYSRESCEWANMSIQGYDQKTKITNTSGRTGVYWIKNRGAWAAMISVDKKNIYLGYFKDYTLAVKAREDAEMKYYGYIKG